MLRPMHEIIMNTLSIAAALSLMLFIPARMELRNKYRRRVGSNYNWWWVLWVTIMAMFSPIYVICYLVKHGSRTIWRGLKQLRNTNFSTDSPPKWL